MMMSDASSLCSSGITYDDDDDDDDVQYVRTNLSI
jgi:hypothetical protein